MSTTESQLLEQIWARPDDRAALSVYADWLIEQGDSARGQYMQLWLLNAPTPAQLRLRDWLLVEHQHEWLGAARPFVTRWTESAASPGFFAHVTCSAENLARGFDAIRALGPRLQVELEPGFASRETMMGLAKTPLGKLYRLELRDGGQDWLTDGLLFHIGPRLEGLRSLALYPAEWGATDASWARLLPYLSTLEQLDLGLGQRADVWVEQLLASPLISRLKRLSVPGWIDPLQRAQLGKAMEGRELAFRAEPRQRFPVELLSQPVG